VYATALYIVLYGYVCEPVLKTDMLCYSHVYLLVFIVNEPEPDSFM